MRGASSLEIWRADIKEIERIGATDDPRQHPADAVLGDQPAARASGSPKRRRPMSSLCRSARNTLPTRPSVGVSWCRMISTGSRESAAEGAAAPAWALSGKRSTVWPLILPD
jgi:hypothetical protein